MNDDDRIAREIGEWAGEGIRAGTAQWRRNDFEERLRRRLADGGRGASRRRWLPLTAGAVLAAAAAIVLFQYRPTPSRSNREAVRFFLMEHTSLGGSSSTASAVPYSSRWPQVKAIPMSQDELKQLLRSALPERDMPAESQAESATGEPAPRELQQAFDLFFSMTLKSIKEKT